MTHKQYIIDQGKKWAGERLCHFCNQPAQGRGHIIPQRLVKKYGWWIIDHWSNFFPTCNGCNSKAQINTTDKEAMRNQLIYILREIMSELKHETNE